MFWTFLIEETTYIVIIVHKYNQCLRLHLPSESFPPPRTASEIAIGVEPLFVARNKAIYAFDLLQSLKSLDIVYTTAGKKDLFLSSLQQVLQQCTCT